MREEIRKLVACCDLEERLTRVPASAKVRGLYFKNDVVVLRKAGLDTALLEYFPNNYSAVRWYPVAEYLQHCAVSGALLCGPENIHEGMRRIGHSNAITFGESLLGRTMFRLLSRDPVKILKQGEAGRRQSCSYGRWETEILGPSEATVTMYEEYVYAESNLVGAAEGTLNAIGYDARVEVEQLGTFDTRHKIHWHPKA